MPRNIRICDIGTKILEFFLVTSTALVISAVWFGPISHTWNFLANPVAWLSAGIAIFLIEFVLFWIGIILVYTSSVQLGVKKRIIGALCGWIPFVNLFMLTGIIKTCRQEVAVERNLAKRDRERAAQQVCKTKYPLLLVHGVFFRDFDHFNYWGRIPAELEKNGATIYYGEHNSAAAVNDDKRDCPTDGMRQGKHHRPLQRGTRLPHSDRDDLCKAVRSFPDDYQHTPQRMRIRGLSAWRDSPKAAGNDREAVQYSRR